MAVEWFVDVSAPLSLGILLAAVVFGIACGLTLHRLDPAPPAMLAMPFPSLEDMLAAGASELVAAYIAHGNKITAIKVYREETGTRGLAAAKNAVDELMLRARTRRMVAAGASMRVAELIARNQTSEAIRAYQEETGAGQREATDMIRTLRSS
jgi:ribosomal protein L7/L12